MPRCTDHGGRSISVIPREASHPYQRPIASPLDLVLGFSRSNRFVVVHVAGELDAYTAPLMRERLLDVILDQGNRSVILELAGVTFIDSAGVSVIIGAHLELRDRGGVLVLRSPSGITRKVLEASGADEVLDITVA